MKRTEVIELNGVEYTLELNRESFLQIDKICDVKKSMAVLQENLYEYVDDIDDDYIPFEEELDREELNKKAEEKDKIIYKLVERSFFIWMYPNHKLKISQVKDIVDPYLEDKDKAEWLVDRLGYFLNECVSIKEASEQKNLKALANK